MSKFKLGDSVIVKGDAAYLQGEEGIVIEELSKAGFIRVRLDGMADTAYRTPLFLEEELELAE